MDAKPAYTAGELSPAFHLRYNWTGWPARGHLFAPIGYKVLDQVQPEWREDGMRLLEWRWRPEQIQLTFSTAPQVAPVKLAQRAKGRLQYELRRADQPSRFSRKLSVSTIGENRRVDIEEYIARQVDHHAYVSTFTQEKYRELTVVDPDVDLSEPTFVHSGRYWYNLHLVLVSLGRVAIGDFKTLCDVRDRCFRIAEKHGSRLARVSVVHDHLHMALRGNILKSPEEIALSMLNNLAHIHGKRWKAGYYAGTFGDYSMGLIRQMSERL